MTIVIAILLALAHMLGLPTTLFEDGSGIIDVVPPTETQWCGFAWGTEDDPDDGLVFGCFQWAAEPLPTA